MAAEASRAPLPVRVGQICAQPKDPFRRAIEEESRFALQIFTSIPEGFGVVEVGKDCHGILEAGEVAVFERHPFGHVTIDDLSAGEIYVQQHNRPVAFAPQPDAFRIVTRDLVRIYHTTDPRLCGVDGSGWYARKLSAPFRRGEGPYYDWGLASTLIGRVVGIYQPVPAGGVA
jgi:hypothetical protein